MCLTLHAILRVTLFKVNAQSYKKINNTKIIDDIINCCGETDGIRGINY